MITACADVRSSSSATRGGRAAVSSSPHDRASGHDRPPATLRRRAAVGRPRSHACTPSSCGSARDWVVLRRGPLAQRDVRQRRARARPAPARGRRRDHGRRDTPIALLRAPSARPSADARRAAPARRAVALTPAQRRVLVALCRPLRDAPHAAPASNRADRRRAALSRRHGQGHAVGAVRALRAHRPAAEREARRARARALSCSARIDPRDACCRPARDPDRAVVGRPCAYGLRPTAIGSPHRRAAPRDRARRPCGRCGWPRTGGRRRPPPWAGLRPAAPTTLRPVRPSTRRRPRPRPASVSHSEPSP